MNGVNVPKVCGPELGGGGFKLNARLSILTAKKVESRA